MAAGSVSATSRCPRPEAPCQARSSYYDAQPHVSTAQLDASARSVRRESAERQSPSDGSADDLDDPPFALAFAKHDHRAVDRVVERHAPAFLHYALIVDVEAALTNETRCLALRRRQPCQHDQFRVRHPA